MPYASNVFVNCPFDDGYKKLLSPLLFCLVYLDFEPKISETSSSSNIRIIEIKKLIGNSLFSIHDISRCRPSPDEFPRFNMPFELGLDLGCQTFGGKKHKSKKCLILETEKFHYRSVLSDISGQDIEDHGDNPETLIRKVCAWLSKYKESMTSATVIWTSYTEFRYDFEKRLEAQKYSPADILSIPNSVLIRYMKNWISGSKAVNKI